MTAKKTALIHRGSAAKAASGHLLRDLRSLIESARERTAQAVNAGLVLLYWSVGQRIRQEILQGKRADYGEKIVPTLSAQLVPEYGLGFSRANIFHMIRFAETFHDKQIVYALSRQLGWTHFRQIIYLDDPLKREFYAEMAGVDRWSTRTLQQKIQGMLYERTALSKKPAKLARQELAALHKEDRWTPDLVFQDPYLLDFLGLQGAYSEKDLESAILRELERFLIELGGDFAFVARQKRITVDHEDYYIDLLFYHRGMRRLVAIELKLGKFRAADKGQVELYLRWLNKYERRPGEELPLGLILCAEKSAEHVELLELEKSGIRVAQYLTELPSRRVMEKKLHDAIKIARERLAALKNPEKKR